MNTPTKEGLISRYISIVSTAGHFILLTPAGWATALLAALVYLTLYTDAPSLWMGVLALVVQACTSREAILFFVGMGGGVRQTL